MYKEDKKNENEFPYKSSKTFKLKKEKAKMLSKNLPNLDVVNNVAENFRNLMVPDKAVRRVLSNIDKQIESFSATMALLEKERSNELNETFEYIEEKGLPNGFSYTLYRAVDDQKEIINLYMEGKLTDDIVSENILDMEYDLEHRIMDRLEFGKELVQSHLSNIFSGKAMLSFHFLPILIEELLKCYEGAPSTNKVSNYHSRESIKTKSSGYNIQVNQLIHSRYHSSELVKKSYDKVLIKQFYMKIVTQKPSELTFLNRHDIVHVFSDMDRYSLIDVYKLLLLISSTLDLLEILDILKEE